MNNINEIHLSMYSYSNPFVIFLNVITLMNIQILLSWSGMSGALGKIMGKFRGKICIFLIFIKIEKMVSYMIGYFFYHGPYYFLYGLPDPLADATSP